MPLIHAMFAATALDHRFFAGEASILSISLAEMVAYVSGFLLLLWLLRNPTGRKEAFRSALAWPNALYFTWIALAGVLALLVTGRNDGLHELKNCAPGAIIFMAICAWARTPERIDAVVKGIVVSLAVLGIIGLSQFAFGWPYVNPVLDIAFGKMTVTGLDRVAHPSVGTFGTQNTYAVFMGPLFVFSVVSTIERVRRTGERLNRLLVVSFVVVAAALVAAQAKLVLAITSLAIATFLAMASLKIRPTRSIVIMLIGIVAASVAAMITVLAVFEQQMPQGLQLGTMRGRLGLAAEATLFIAAERGVALVGGGAATFQETRGLQFNVHNEFLLQGLKWGVLGAGLFTLVMGSTLLRTRGQWAGPLAISAALLIYMVETATGNQQQTALFLLLGLAQAQSRHARPWVDVRHFGGTPG